jgi:hypothetical protein
VPETFNIGNPQEAIDSQAHAFFTICQDVKRFGLSWWYERRVLHRKRGCVISPRGGSTAHRGPGGCRTEWPLIPIPASWTARIIYGLLFFGDAAPFLAAEEFCGDAYFLRAGSTEAGTACEPEKQR